MPASAPLEQIPEQGTPVLKIDAGRAMEHANSVDVASDLISIARCRELMGDEAEGLSNQDVGLIRRHADAMAHALVEIFLDNSTRPE